MRPKYLYKISEIRTVAHAEDGASLTLQQGPPSYRPSAPDSLIFLDRENAIKLRGIITNWLRESADVATQKATDQ